MIRWSVATSSAGETLALGKRLGALLEQGDFVALTGDLGTGKTQFVKGVAAGLAVDPSTVITSPTYTLLNTYFGRLPLYHFDLYRLRGDQDVAELGFEEYFHARGASLVEWADRLRDELPDERLTVALHHEGGDHRRIDLSAEGGRYDALLDALSKPGC